MKDPNLHCLPFEVIERIMDYNVISHVDICNLSRVSRIFGCIANSNKLWKNKYMLMWPNLFPLFDAKSTDWKKEFRTRYELKKTITETLKTLASRLYFQDILALSEFKEFEELCKFHPLGQNLIIDELECITSDDMYNNLTLKYYAKGALRLMQYMRMRESWRVFTSTERSYNAILLEGTCLVSRWCQPHRKHCTSEVSVQINSLAEKVFEKIRKRAPEHPLIENGLLTSGEEITKSLWSPLECRTVLRCISSVMFRHMEFSGTSNETSHIEYCCFIDKVLVNRSGTGRLLAIVYSSVAALLGVKCVPVNFPEHFLLKCYDEESKVCTYVDVLEDGKLKTHRELFVFTSDAQAFPDCWYEVADPSKIFNELCFNLVEIGRHYNGAGDASYLYDAYELLSILCPNYKKHRFRIDRCSRQNIKERPSQPRSGAENVRYAIGMVMKHQFYNCRCVIYNWDVECKELMHNIFLPGNNLAATVYKQPYYDVLVNHGTKDYVPEDELEIDDSNDPIANVKVGKYFESFHGNYYLPNEQKRREYPDDIEAREQALNGYVPPFTIDVDDD